MEAGSPENRLKSGRGIRPGSCRLSPVERSLERRQLLEGKTPQHEVLLQADGVKPGLLAERADRTSLVHGFTVCGTCGGRHLVAASLC